MDALPFTGERFTPECEGRIAYEHRSRYRVALDFARGRHVLDLACGEGYGSEMLAKVAASVTGVDASDYTIAHANQRYANVPGLKFVCARAHQTSLPDATYDMVVSFETLEHLREHDEMMDEIKRVMKPDGVLIISSPNKAIYTDRDGMRNPHHLRELYLNEFEDLLNRHFSFVEMYGQRILGVSVLANLKGCDSDPSRLQTPAGYDGERFPDAQYFVALASNDPNAATLDALDSVYWDPRMEPR